MNKKTKGIKNNKKELIVVDNKEIIIDPLVIEFYKKTAYNLCKPMPYDIPPPQIPPICKKWQDWEWDIHQIVDFTSDYHSLSYLEYNIFQSGVAGVGISTAHFFGINPPFSVFGINDSKGSTQKN